MNIFKRINERIEDHGKLLFLMKSGSHLYHLNTESSDEDYVGVFMPKEEYFFGLKNIEQIDCSKKDKDENNKNTSEAIDCVLYEIRKFTNLCFKCNPNILEMLFVNDSEILFENSVFKKYREMLSINCPYKKGIEGAFFGYARNQQKKMLEKIDNLCIIEDTYKFLKNFLERDKDNNKLLIWEMKENKEFQQYFTFKNHSVSVKNIRNFIKTDTLKIIKDKLQRTVNSYGNRTNSMREIGYDKKFASHVFRLLSEGKQLMETGKIKFPLDDRDFIMDVKLGKLSRKEVVELSDKYIEDFNNCNNILPDKPKFNKINNELIEFVKNYIKDGTSL